MVKRFLVLSTPRNGSNYFRCLTRCSPVLAFIPGEPLNREKVADYATPNQLLQQIDEEFQNYLSTIPSHVNFVGVKVMTEQLVQCNLNLDKLVRTLGIDFVFILWRSSLLESYVSLRSAQSNSLWYGDAPNPLITTSVDKSDLEMYSSDVQNYWLSAFRCWPIEIRPIFVEYETLCANPKETMEKTFRQASIPLNGDEEWIVDIVKQNPQPITVRVSNYDLIIPYASMLNVKQLFEESNKLNLNHLAQEIMPSREPPIPSNGWLYSVAKPFIPTNGISDVLDALETGNVSSASSYVTMMAEKLKQMFGYPVAQPCCNGYAAIVLALQACNIHSGDCVLIPDWTMVAVANAVIQVGATPIYVDNAQDTYNPGVSEYLNTVVPNVKAVIVCHTYGVPADVAEISNMCHQNGWYLIEDISECVGVRIKQDDQVSGRLLGTFGDFCCASMYANKMIHSGDGGFVLAKDKTIGATLKSLCNHAFTGSYHFLHYRSAMNCKINGLGAALACSLIDSVESIYLHRSELAKFYRRELNQLYLSGLLEIMPRCGLHDTPWVFGVHCLSKSTRDELRDYLGFHEIETRNYFFSLHLQPAFSNHPQANSSFPHSERLAGIGFYLPTHSNLKESDVIHICTVLKSFFMRNLIFDCPKLVKKDSFDTIRWDYDLNRLTVRSFKDGRLIDKHVNNHILLDLAAISVDFYCCMKFLRRDFCLHIYETAKEIESRSTKEGLCPSVIKSFQIDSIIRACHFFLDFEPSLSQPWIDFELPSTKEFENIPTTTSNQLLQFLGWLVKYHDAHCVFEVGTLFGKAAAIMANSINADVEDRSVFAIDTFSSPKKGIAKFVKPQIIIPKGETMSMWQHFISPTIESLRTKVIPIDGDILSIDITCSELGKMKADVVFIDFTRDLSELLLCISNLESTFVDGRTVVVINGFGSTLDFTPTIQSLKPLYKPNGMYCAAFLYKLEQKKKDLVSDSALTCINSPIKFCDGPGWDHHHNNAFESAIQFLRSKYHNEAGNVLFIPAVEQWYCDFVETDNNCLINHDWVGVVHSVPDKAEVSYVPDLHVLCSKHDILAKCRGLFTLTSVQANYLRINLPAGIPVTQLYYPMAKTLTVVKQRDPSALIASGSHLELVQIGGYMRDLSWFCSVNIPHNFCKVILAGEKSTILPDMPTDVSIRDRLSSNDYEALLQTCVVCLSLKKDGVANTIVIECIQRCVPILVPSFQSIKDYIGDSYPLMYDAGCNDLSQFLTFDKIRDAITYLNEMDKSHLTIEYFSESFARSSVYLSLPPPPLAEHIADDFGPDGSCVGEYALTRKFDVTISICSFKRSHNIEKILASLWSTQDFTGTYEIILWNNNANRRQTLWDICEPYMQSSNGKRSLRLINSSANYFCAIRLALPPLLRSDDVVICDDDIIPGPHFLSFFVEGRRQYSNAFLCVRGHIFLEHELNSQDPTSFWEKYEYLRFVGDDKFEQPVHFVHADACMISKDLLHKSASIPMPDPTFALVDDYWISFVLSFYHQIPLIKLQITTSSILERTEDSDCATIALHKRLEVLRARVRMYIHHMNHGWPFRCGSLDSCQYQPILSRFVPKLSNKEMEAVAFLKREAWSNYHNRKIGMNVEINLAMEDVTKLCQMNIKTVRIGVVGTGNGAVVSGSFDLFVASEHPMMLRSLLRSIDMLAEYNIDVVLTLPFHIACVELWRSLAVVCCARSNVIAYDIINEPFSQLDKKFSEGDMLGGMMSKVAGSSETVDDILAAADDFRIGETYKNLVSAIRQVDSNTVLMFETPYWAHHTAVSRLLKILHGVGLLDSEPTCLISVHFYSPRLLTSNKNNSRFSYPGKVPLYELNWGDDTTSILCSSDFFCKALDDALYQLSTYGISPSRFVVGELGIVRYTQGAKFYLLDFIRASKERSIPVMLYAFREKSWSAMNYELGSEKHSTSSSIDKSSNMLDSIIELAHEEEKLW
eukprot:gene13088-17542_t